MFCTLESAEGAGKSSLSKVSTLALTLSGTPFVHTRQPGGTPLGEILREAILWTDENLTVAEEVMLVSIARKRTWEAVIKPALDDGKAVICERWNASTAAYQGMARNHGSRYNQEGTMEYLQDTLRYLGLVSRRPDVSIFFDVDAQTGIDRKGAVGKLDRFESEKTAFIGRANDALRDFHERKVHWMMNDSRVICSNQPLVSVAEEYLGVLFDLNLIKSSVIDEAITQGLK